MAADGVNRLQVSGNFSSDNVNILLRMAVQGQGVIRLADFLVGQSVREGCWSKFWPTRTCPSRSPSGR